MPAPRATVKPLAPERYALHVTLSRETREKLQRAQELLGHAIAPGDVAEVLDRALEALIAALEKRKFGKGATPRPGKSAKPARSPRPAKRSRHIPLAIRREVTQRDDERCTYVSASGHRCEARGGLQFDHVRPFARGGESTAANLRLRCAAHNRLEAERAYGAAFMDAWVGGGIAGPSACPPAP